MEFSKEVLRAHDRIFSSDKELLEACRKGECRYLCDCRDRRKCLYELWAIEDVIRDAGVHAVNRAMDELRKSLTEGVE